MPTGYGRFGSEAGVHGSGPGEHLVAVPAAVHRGCGLLGRRAAHRHHCPRAAAVAASQQRLDLAAVIVVSVIAGEAGGLAGYAIGRRWGRRLLERPGRHLARREKVMERGERLYARLGWLAVFVTPAIVSGTAKMPPCRFAMWNLLDALGWTVSVAASAYGVGRLATGHHTWHDIAILVIGLAAGAPRHRHGRAASPHAHRPASCCRRRRGVPQFLVIR